ncbi:Small-conductance mechanosensitive channel [Draconibacterium orientale]|uniref:Membrane protein n=1 Tax=Draconibacterium orientale TaxID=1168034 RepID=X5DGX0_9BACT|nr:mechanosensitive ion channel domain-containing protein [Draconibacterium orientale]AHW59707.1 membrane protein [Draconibacterium orientale]SES78268.1 Small-conductance mechanosensitive channel [Draconibacterium orientale]
MKKIIKFIIPFLLLLIAVYFLVFVEKRELVSPDYYNFFKKAGSILLIVSIAWSLMAILRAFKKVILSKFDTSKEDNLRQRKFLTQFNIMESIIYFLIVLIAIGASLMLFEEVRQLGISLFASAGVAGIIIGFAAQKLIATVLAGLQIAITQPIRIDDVVVIENEWGRIEEITLTYVVVKIWDQRRLVVPSTYFFEKPFQNWTRTSAEILGTVFLYTDYHVSFDALRKELTRLLESTPLWDKRVNVLQVTDAKEYGVEIRALVSAKDSPTAWDLRVFIREKMIEFIQKNYPESLPRTRVVFEQGEQKSTTDLLNKTKA